MIRLILQGCYDAVDQLFVVRAHVGKVAENRVGLIEVHQGASLQPFVEQLDDPIGRGHDAVSSGHLKGFLSLAFPLVSIGFLLGSPKSFAFNSHRAGRHS